MRAEDVHLAFSPVEFRVYSSLSLTLACNYVALSHEAHPREVPVRQIMQLHPTRRVRSENWPITKHVCQELSYGILPRLFCCSREIDFRRRKCGYEDSWHRETDGNSSRGCARQRNRTRSPRSFLVISRHLLLSECDEMLPPLSAATFINNVSYTSLRISPIYRR